MYEEEAMPFLHLQEQQQVEAETRTAIRQMMFEERAAEHSLERYQDAA